MAKTTAPDTIVVIDDEPHNIIWMVDYLENNGLIVKVASDVAEAIGLVDSQIYRALIIDLNIPVDMPFREALLARGGVYAKYPGLFVAERARNKGYRDRQVVIYSVHKDPAVSEEANKLGATYILKGRPKEIKEEIESIVSYDPTQ